MELKPKPNWSENIAKDMGSLNSKIQYLTVNYGICTTNPEKTDLDLNSNYLDQIVNLNGEITQQETELKFASFNNKETLENQIRHEIIHHIGWIIAQQIFGKETKNFSKHTELVVAGLDLANFENPQFLSVKNKIFNLYYFVFQSAVKILCENFISKKEIVKNVNIWVENSIKKFNNSEDIVINYAPFLDKFPVIFGIDQISISVCIDMVIAKIKEKKKFDNWDEKGLPEVEDYLALLELYSAQDIFKMIKENVFFVTRELAEKYEVTIND